MVLSMRTSTVLSSSSRTKPRSTLLLLLSLVLLLLLTPSHAAIACHGNHSLCEERLRPGSYCDDDSGHCTNPFAGGCLRSVLGEEKALRYTAQRYRACNSDDNADGSSECSSHDDNYLLYPEIRISNGNWESSMFLAWIFQILLSELLGVPATIETSSEDNGSFYDLQNRFTYATRTYNWDGLKIPLATPNGDCRQADPEEYCTHVVPEVWPSQRSVVSQNVDDRTIVPVSSLDVVGRLGIFVPTFTAQRDLSLTSVLGLSDLGSNGTANRHKVAEAFKLPTTWSDYCALVSADNCTTPDETAQRAPQTQEEATKYWVADSVYRGHFRATPHNDCARFPHNCTGHFVDGRCDWSTLAQAQLYWNQIPVTSALGPMEPYGSYGYWSMVEIWHAANETRSDVLMWWWSTDWMLQSFIGTAGEFVKVDLPAPTLGCIQNRVSEQGKCGEDPLGRVGGLEGSCDYEPAVLVKAVSSALQTQQQGVPVAEQSAALPLIQDFRTSDLVLDYLLKEWYLQNNDRFGYDPRNVVCRWVADNIEDLKRVVPRGYPRRVLPQDDKYDSPAFRAARWLAVAVGVASLLSLALVVAWRKRRVIRYAQPDFLYLVLLGFLLLSASALLYTLEPQSTTCILRPWFGLLGSSLELLPLIVKVQAILKALNQANNFRRVKIQRIHLLGAVFVFMGVITCFLVAWTVVDPPTRQEELVLTEQTNDVGGLYVQVQLECASDSSWWVIVGLLWQLLLLFCATILAYQTRNIRTEFNESQFLGFMIYTHFMFVLLRFILVVLVADNFTPADRQVVQSYLLTMDTFVTLNIYFAPKFYSAMYNQRGAQAFSTTTRWTTQNNSMLASHMSGRPNVGSSGPMLGSSAGLGVESVQEGKANSNVEANSGVFENKSMAPSDDGTNPKLEEAQDEYDSDDGGEEAQPLKASEKKKSPLNVSFKGVVEKA